MAGEDPRSSVHRIALLVRGTGVIDVGGATDVPRTVDDRHDAFSAFYRAEVDGQVRRAALMLGASAIANDVVHDAFVQVFRRWREIEEPGPYLNRAVLNGCRDVGRRVGRDQRMTRRWAIAAIAEPPEDSLADALQRLPFMQRAAVVLRFYVGLSVAEIADCLGCRPGTVGPSITRGLRQLREEITR